MNTEHASLAADIRQVPPMFSGKSTTAFCLLRWAALGKPNLSQGKSANMCDVRPSRLSRHSLVSVSSCAVRTSEEAAQNRGTATTTKRSASRSMSISSMDRALYALEHSPSQSGILEYSEAFRLCVESARTGAGKRSWRSGNKIREMMVKNGVKRSTQNYDMLMAICLNSGATDSVMMVSLTSTCDGSVTSRGTY
jgi:hypothetical protein